MAGSRNSLALLTVADAIQRIRSSALSGGDSGDYKVAASNTTYLRATGSEKSADARLQLANIYYFNLQRYDRARTHYTTFLNENSSHASASLAQERLAEVLGELGRTYDAIAEYENMSPQDSNERRRLRLRIADLYFAQKNYSQALTEYEKVIEAGVYDDLTEQAYLREGRFITSNAASTNRRCRSIRGWRWIVRTRK